MFRRVYYNKETGASIMTYSTNREKYEKPSFGQDKKTYSHFDGLKEAAVGFLDFENGEYERDFIEAFSFKINLETLEPEFFYREPGEPEPVQAAEPLTAQIDGLKGQVAALEARIAKLESKTTTTPTK